jgi:hypothetical protein
MEVVAGIGSYLLMQLVGKVSGGLNRISMLPDDTSLAIFYFVRV